MTHEGNCAIRTCVLCGLGPDADTHTAFHPMCEFRPHECDCEPIADLSDGNQAGTNALSASTSASAAPSHSLSLSDPSPSSAVEQAREKIAQIELAWLNDRQYQCLRCGKSALCKHHELLLAAKQLADLLASVVQPEQLAKLRQKDHDHGAGLAAVGNDTGSSQTETASELDKRGFDDYAQACEMTPSGFNVTSWMEEMDEQHTTMKAVLRELLAEMKRCYEAGEQFDFLSKLVTRAYDTVGVIRVTQSDLDELEG